ncbi:hypothetical protein VaNZ11_003394 [Volvox africanus]|uniref:Pseudouridine synthase RsuA/RluA-like domain-containing protein n=1 Tax=Volvox africanus TaxID=51714 RepID=A0ABQ5RUK9_9CHLO|nr:hypothetical protein VaNZ11_003394 [Volvox africanus]
MLRCDGGPFPYLHQPLAPPTVRCAQWIPQPARAGSYHILYFFPSALPRTDVHLTTWPYGDPRIPIFTSSVTRKCRTSARALTKTLSICHTYASIARARYTTGVSSTKLRGTRTTAVAEATRAVVHKEAESVAAAGTRGRLSEAKTLQSTHSVSLAVPTPYGYLSTRQHSCRTSGIGSRSRSRRRRASLPRLLVRAAAAAGSIFDGAASNSNNNNNSTSSSSTVAGFSDAASCNASLQDASSTRIDTGASTSKRNSPTPHDTRPDVDEIANRIAASRSRRATRLSYNCPACSISAGTPVNISRHMARCCPDLMAPDAAAWTQLESLARGFPSPQHDTVVALLRGAGSREQDLRRRVLACVFWSGPVDPVTGLPERLQVEQAAQKLGLPLTRAAAVLQRAMAAVPLASDSSGPPLDVVFEDEHFLAVNKPLGGSVVNQIIAYLNRGRAPKYGGDGSQVTLLTPGGLPPYDSSVPELMPVPEPFTLTSAATSSSSLSSSPSSTASDLDDIALNCSAAPYQLEPYVLHRLDMNTSGLLLFAKRQEVVAGMHRQFRERTLSKLYLAATVGCPGGGTGNDEGSSGSSNSSGSSRLHFRVDAPIDRHPDHAVARLVADSGKEASTSFAVLATNPRVDLGPTAGGAPGLLFHERGVPGTFARFSGADHLGGGGSSSSGSGNGGAAVAAVAAERSSWGSTARDPAGASLVLCAPHTGRTHQIRVHLHHMGHPIVGDDIYGVTGPWLNRQALHAAALRFTHPLTGRSVRLTAPLHDDMAACLAALGLPQVDESVLAEMEEEWARRSTAGASGEWEGRRRGRMGEGS